MDVICEDGSLDGMWMKSDARRCLMCDVWVCVAVKGVHDVMNSRGDEWNGDSWCSELDGSVSGC